MEGLYSIVLGEAHRVQGNLDAARLCVRRGLTLARGVQYDYGMAWAQRILGRLALDDNALRDAQERFQETLSTFVVIQAHFEIARTHLDRADLAQRQGNRHAVTLHLTEAYQRFVALQTPVYVERTARRAADVGLTLTEAPGRQP